jgi:hypothetical protein
MLEQLKKMNQELEDLKKSHLDRSKKMFTEISKVIFDKHPKLTSFGWRQYTPYFNDGEECVFRTYADTPFLNGIDPDERDEEDNLEGENILLNTEKYIYKEKLETEEELLQNNTHAKEEDMKWLLNRTIGQSGYVLNPKYNPSDGEIEKDVKGFLEAIDEDTLKDLFGDHVQVTVKRSGTETEEYEHD